MNFFTKLSKKSKIIWAIISLVYLLILTVMILIDDVEGGTSVELLVFITASYWVFVGTMYLALEAHSTISHVTRGVIGRIIDRNR